MGILLLSAFLCYCNTKQIPPVTKEGSSLVKNAIISNEKSLIQEGGEKIEITQDKEKLNWGPYFSASELSKPTPPLGLSRVGMTCYFIALLQLLRLYPNFVKAVVQIVNELTLSQFNTIKETIDKNSLARLPDTLKKPALAYQLCCLYQSMAEGKSDNPSTPRVMSGQFMEILYKLLQMNGWDEDKYKQEDSYKFYHHVEELFPVLNNVEVVRQFIKKEDGRVLAEAPRLQLISYVLSSKKPGLIQETFDYEAKNLLEVSEIYSSTLSTKIPKLEGYGQFRIPRKEGGYEVVDEFRPGEQEGVRTTSINKVKEFPFLLFINQGGEFDGSGVVDPARITDLYLKVYQEEKLVEVEPTAITVHYGNANSGHYIAFLKKKEQWYKCNDSTVTLIQGNVLDHISAEGHISLILYDKKK